MSSALLPEFDFSERHSIRIDAPQERIWSVLRHGEMPAPFVLRALLALRRGGSGPREFSLDRALSSGFSLLAEDPPRSIVMGIEGPFWKPNCKVRRVDATSFREPVPNGVARGAWDFVVHEDGTVTTETRVLCASDSRWKFGIYWLFIRPFSGLIRRMILRSLRRAAER